MTDPHVTRALFESAAHHIDRVALRAGAEVWTYGELRGRVAGAMHALRARGVQPGDAVGILADNQPALVAAWFAVVGVGARVVPLSPHSTERELRSFAPRGDHPLTLRAIVASEAYAERPAGAELRSFALSSLTSNVADEETSAEPRGVAMMLFTSGTTGHSKLARIGHDALLDHTRSLQRHVLMLGPQDRVLACLPLAHSFGIRMTALTPLLAGAEVLIAPRFDAHETLALAETHGVTWLAGVPTMFARWAEVAGEPLPSLRWALSAGAALPEDVRRRASDRLGAPVRQGYGLTEATFCCIDTEGVAGSVGRPVPGVEVELRQERIHVRGANLMRGYLGEPDHRGFFDTGDLGHLDADGRLFVTGRSKDLVVRGGHNVNPVEVEALLHGAAGVSQVAVIGRPDPALGEELVAVLVVTDAFSAAAFATFAEQNVPRPRRPREFAIVESLPLGRSRKVLRRVLRERIEAGALEVRPLWGAR